LFTLVVVTIEGGLEGFEALQQEKADREAAEEEFNRMLEGKNGFPRTPAEKKLDPRVITNSDDGGNVPATPPAEEKKLEDPKKGESKKDDKKDSGGGDDSEAASEVVNGQRASNAEDKRPWVESTGEPAANGENLKIKTADSQIPGSLKKSGSYHSELGDLTRDELQKLKDQGGDQSDAAGDMLKLIKERERLLDKNK
jgi:hypothetical protein